MASELILKIFSGVAAGIVGITKPIECVSVLTQVTRTLGIRAKNSSSIKDTNALRDSADDGQTPKVAGAAETRICNPRLVLM
jgi:hypothetical protein